MPAHQDVTLGVLEHVAHVQIAGDIGRGEQDVEALAAGGTVLGRSWLREELLPDPVLGPVIFDGSGVVRYGQIVRHWALSAVSGECPETLIRQGFQARGLRQLFEIGAVPDSTPDPITGTGGRPQGEAKAKAAPLGDAALS